METRAIKRRPFAFDGAAREPERWEWSVGVPGDVDGDGVLDLIVSVSNADDLRSAVWVVLLDAAGTVKACLEIDPLRALRISVIWPKRTKRTKKRSTNS